MSYLDRIGDACSFAQAGFYYEEGGCFGMALALAQTADELNPGAVCRLAFNQRSVHAYVEFDGDLCDHSGLCSFPKDIEYVSLEEMRALALANGNDDDSLAADIEAATEIVRAAVELDNDREKLAAAIAEHVGLGIGDTEELLDHLVTPDNATFVWHVVGSDYIYAALSTGSPAQDQTIRESVNPQTYRLIKEAFSTEAGGAYFRNLIEQVTLHGLYGAADHLGECLVSAPSKGPCY
jgi:hypothetical protein